MRLASATRTLRAQRSAPRRSIPEAVSPAGYCLPRAPFGGPGGESFSEIIPPAPNCALPQADGRTSVARVRLWPAYHLIAGVQLVYANADGRHSAGPVHGTTHGRPHEHEFQPGERLSSLVIFQARIGTSEFVGGVSFRTNAGRIFDCRCARVADRKEMDVGSGVIVGTYGRSSDYLDQLGFWLRV